MAETDTSDIRIRYAGANDAEHFVTFNQRMAQETEGKRLSPQMLAPGVRAVLENPSHGFYVAADCNGQIVGGLLVTFEWSDWRNGVFWWVQSVYVDNEFRGRSIYSKLYDFVREQARERGDVCGFRLYVDSDNVHAQRVYAALGMQRTNYLLYEEEIGL